MTTLIIVICIVAFLIWVGRLLRQRELKKFRDVDVGMLSELRQQHPDVSTPSSQSIDPVQPLPVQVKPAPLVESLKAGAGLSDLVKPALKSRLFEDRTQDMLALLESQLAAEYRVLLAVCVQEFVLTSNQETVSFLIVDNSFAPVLAVEYFDKGFTEPLKILKDLSFPFMRVERNESAPSIRLKLKSLNRELVEAAGSAPSCPLCSSDMSLREPKAGKNAGKRYWLCREYPKCRGHVSA
jgi:hypothetical protein